MKYLWPPLHIFVGISIQISYDLFLTIPDNKPSVMIKEASVVIFQYINVVVNVNGKLKNVFWCMIICEMVIIVHRLGSFYEKQIYETQCDRITPLVTNPGRVMLTSEQLYFQAFNNIDPVPVVKVKLMHIKSLIKRRFILRRTVRVYEFNALFISHFNSCYLNLENVWISGC